MTTTPAPAPKQRSTGRTILTIFLVLIVLCVVCVVGAFVVAGPAISNLINAAAAPISASNDFMNAVIANDYAKAYGMIDPSQQSNWGGSADGLKQTLTNKGLVPSKFAPNNVLFGTDLTSAKVDGTGTFNGNSKYVYLYLQKNGDAWKIQRIEVNDNPPTPTPTK